MERRAGNGRGVISARLQAARGTRVRECRPPTEAPNRSLPLDCLSEMLKVVGNRRLIASE